ncbi:Methyl farnesoate epoxidase [Orchesella cincta]|uniref:Methyl farnesoate epoxidase n=1 Tax=Orchesella cincta TaxID=48709 RepID=A0A1D2M917_ORCCI|nr:Methyl farnesoate epoxidase [Orchesella cincta]
MMSYEIFVTILVALIFYFLIVLFTENFINKRNQPPGPLRLPIVGNLIQLAWINSKEPHTAFTKLSQTYGDIMSIQLGSVSSVVLNSFDLMQEYLSKAEFSDRYFLGWLVERTYGKRLGLVFSQYPNPWNDLHRFTLRTMRDFGFGKRNTMHSVIHDELSDVINELKTCLNEHDGIYTFDDSNVFITASLNLVWSMLAGTRYEHRDPKLRQLTKITRDWFASCNTGNSVLVAFPEWKDWFPYWTGMTFQRKCYEVTNSFFQQFVDERKRLGFYKTSPENLVDEFLRQIETCQEKGVDENIFTEQQLVALISDFFIAGVETTGNTLVWCILYLLHNPEVQKRVQAEVDSLVPQGTFPTPEIESKLHYVRATIAETHRMASVFPLMIPRAPTQDTYIGKYFIPKGTYIVPNMHGMHHDKSYWKDPENFRPERFLDETRQFKTDPRLKAFGFGKRICVGEPLASMSLLHFLVVLMQNFTFHSVPNKPLPSIKPIVGVTCGPPVFRALIKRRF